MPSIRPTTILSRLDRMPIRRLRRFSGAGDVVVAVVAVISEVRK
jgi:hypothetical protein